MSFQINISGHSSNPHNKEVEAAFKDLVVALGRIDGVSGTASGYSNDGTGSVSLSSVIPLPAASGD